MSLEKSNLRALVTWVSHAKSFFLSTYYLRHRQRNPHLLEELNFQGGFFGSFSFYM
jgi:hypothetical protein